MGPPATSWVQGLGFRVQGSGCRFQGFGLRVYRVSSGRVLEMLENYLIAVGAFCCLAIF